MKNIAEVLESLHSSIFLHLLTSCGITFLAVDLYNREHFGSIVIVKKIEVFLAHVPRKDWLHKQDNYIEIYLAKFNYIKYFSMSLTFSLSLSL